MANNYWMIVQTEENYQITVDRGFDLVGLTKRQRKRAQRMEPEDRVLFYISGLRKWAASAFIESECFEDDEIIWQSVGSREEIYPYRAKIRKGISLKPNKYINGLELGPTLEYTKRWSPKLWYLAFVDTIHLLPQRDCKLIENEMRRTLKKKLVEINSEDD